MHITTKDHSGFRPAPLRMTLNDLECPIHLKVRFADGTLDVRTLWLSDSTIRRCSQRRESGLEGLVPLPLTWAADALFLCGS